MMEKKLGFILVLLFVIITNINAQENAEIVKTKKNIFEVNNQFSKPSRDYVMLTAGFATWQLPTGSTVKLKQRGIEYGGYLCYDFPFQKSNFSFGAGIGLASTSIYLDSMKLYLTDTSSRVYFVADTFGSSKRFKLNTTYLEAPFELRYFANKMNRNRGFKAAVGVRIGSLINAHTKDIRSTSAGVMRDKESSRRFFETWRLTPTIRLGYGNFSIYGSYQITEVFKPNNPQGSSIRPMSIGICITGM